MLTFPGITFAIGLDRRCRALACDVAAGQLNVDVFETSFGVGFNAHHATFYDRTVFQRDDLGVLIVVDGYILGADGSLRQPSDLCLEYRQSGRNGLKNLNGAFNLMVWDGKEGSLFFVTDRFEIRPSYVYRLGAQLVLSSNISHISKLIPVRLKPSSLGLMNQLCFSRIWLDDLTLWEGVSALPSSSFVDVTQVSGVTIDRYWKVAFEETPVDLEEASRYCASAFTSAVTVHASTSTGLGIGLSGGLDSRLVAASLAGEGRVATTCFTWGCDQGSDEIVIAKRVASSLGMSWRFVHASPESFVRDFVEASKLMGGRDLVTQSYMLSVAKEISASASVCVAGLALDLTLGGSYSSRFDGIQLNEPRGFERLLLECFSTLSEGELDVVFSNVEEARETHQSLRTRLLSYFGKSSLKSLPNDVDAFALEARVHGYIHSRQNWQRVYVEDIAPTLDTRFMETVLRVPASQRSNHQFYQLVAKKICADVLEIPYQRTMLPASVPTRFWKEASRIELAKEQLLRDIYRESLGDHFVPLRRYYSNFDEWHRRNSSWIGVTDELLLAEDSRLCGPIVRRDWVEKVIREHRSCERAQSGLLNTLLTVETALRAMD